MTADWVEELAAGFRVSTCQLPGATRELPAQRCGTTTPRAENFTETLACRPGSLGATALHTAVWTNHVEMVAELLSAGASPDVRDVESGWTALHKALHLGYLRVATILLEFGASLHVEDTEGRMPADLLSLDACQGAQPLSGKRYCARASSRAH